MFPFGIRTGRIEEAAERILSIESAAEHLFPDLIRTSWISDFENSANVARKHINLQIRTQKIKSRFSQSFADPNTQTVQGGEEAGGETSETSEEECVCERERECVCVGVRERVRMSECERERVSEILSVCVSTPERGCLRGWARWTATRGWLARRA